MPGTVPDDILLRIHAVQPFSFPLLVQKKKKTYENNMTTSATEDATIQREYSVF